MKKIFSIIFCLFLAVGMIACTGEKTKAVELMGAGDKIHDSFTFANIGVNLEEIDENIYEISGSVERMDDKKIKDEFEIDEDVTNVVALKLNAVDVTVVKEKVKVYVDGGRVYDAEPSMGQITHLLFWKLRKVLLFQLKYCGMVKMKGCIQLNLAKI